MATGTPSLDNVLLVENLQANLISVSKLCDEIGEVETSCEDTNMETHEPAGVTNTDFEDFESKSVTDALADNDWILAMQEELNQFKRNDVWYLILCPKDSNVIGTKWIFRNKIDEKGQIMLNKARLVAQGYTQIEGFDFDETFAPVARLESVRLLLSIACHLRFKLHPMDVKSYSDADWAGNIDDRKSTTGGCFYIGNNLVSWFSKKQNCVFLSTVEAEYIVARSCCTQLLLMKQMLNNYGIRQDWAMRLHYLENTHSQLHAKVSIVLVHDKLH
ncbi:unnamed protein product [Prunus armeniaca]